jgi:hypothetical protein
MNAHQAFPLHWPEGWRRTPASVRRTNSTWKKQSGAYRDELMDQLRMLNAERVVLSTNMQLRRDGLPYAERREPEDPGVAVYFERRGHKYVLACDQFSEIRLNIHAIGLTIEAMRQIERCGASDMLERAFRGFAALPSAEHLRAWREVLGFTANEVVTPEIVTARFRALALKAHPDQGGDAKQFQQLTAAREAALNEVAQ